MNILITSDSKTLLDDELKKIIKDSINKIVYNYSEVSLSDILEEAGYVSMFNEMKYLIIKNVSLFGKEKENSKNSESLINYLSKPNPNTTLIFTTYDGVDKRKSIFKKWQELAEYKELKAPIGYELINETKKMIMKKNYLIEDNGVRYIVNACVNNYDLIVNEINKFSLLLKENTMITMDILKDLISVNVKDNQFKFVDAVILKDMKLSFDLLEDLKCLKVESLQLINLLAREYRLMLMVSLMEGKHNSKEIMQELKLADWQLQKIIKNKAKYHFDDLKDNLLFLTKLDYEIKSGLKDKWLGFESFLVNLFEY